MEVEESKLSLSMEKNFKDIIAGAFQYASDKYESKYIVERLREMYGTEQYNFCCVVGSSFNSYYSYFSNVYFRCKYKGKYINIWSGK